MKKVLVFAVAAATGLLAMSTTASAFSTKRCQACHAIDHVKIGPAWKDVVAAYKTPDTLAKVFKDGFPVSERKIASTQDKFKHKAGLMTGQFNNLIKGHEDDAAKALFATVKNNKFGDY
ncbi:MAG TPA: hypothetical protein VNH42_07075 [Mariprofundaceae bacterium]|nr:hypothetical protein [Mariprofundaceae bacterium]